MEIPNTKIGSLSVDVKLSVDYDTMKACLRLLELYLNSNDSEKLIINCSDVGNWDLDIVSK